MKFRKDVPAGASTGGDSPGTPAQRGAGVLSGGSPRLALLFLLPAVLLLAAFQLYPTFYSVIRSLFDSSGAQFVGVRNYINTFTDDRTLTAIRNTALWVLLAPAVVTGLGLVFAVLTERIKLVNDGKTMEVEYTLVDPTMWQGDWKSTKRYNRADHTDINEANCILQYNANLPGTNLGSETAEERGKSEVEGVTDEN